MKVLVVFLISSLLITTEHVMATRVEHTVEKVFESCKNGSLSEIKTAERKWHLFNSSDLNLAKVLSASLNGTDFSFSTIETKVAPSLFLAFSTIPNLAQISYIGRDGFVFSYLHDGNQTLAVYSNISHSSTVDTPNPTMTSWYRQLVNCDTGKRYGEAKCMNSMANVNGSWFQEVLSSANGYKLGKNWNKDQTLVLLHIVAIDGIGVVSLGFSVRDIMNSFSNIYFQGGELYMATKHGDARAHSGPLSKKIVFNSGTMTVQLVEQTGDSASQVANISCESINFSSQDSNAYYF